MRVLRITHRGQVHHATETDEYSSRGNPFIVCNCGATGYGLTGITYAHNRGDWQMDPVQIVPQPERPTGWRWIYDPEWSNAQEKREIMSRNLDRKGRPAWWIHAMERLFCRRYGHTPSADPQVCVYCQRRRGGKREGRWNPQPQPERLPERVLPPQEPDVLRYRFPPMSTVHGPAPIPGPARPAIEPPRRQYRHQLQEHPNTPAESCPICMGPPPGVMRPAPEPCHTHHRTNCPYCTRRSR